MHFVVHVWYFCKGKKKKERKTSWKMCLIQSQENGERMLSLKKLKFDILNE